MSQTGYTPIQLYYSTTASTAPTAGNLASGELAINITDGILFYKDNAGVVQTLATKAATSGTYTSITLSGGTANGVAYLNGSKVVTTGSALTFDGNKLSVGNNTEGTLYFNGASFGLIRSLSDLYYDGNAQIFRNAAASSEYMRLTSTGLGIGTSSPSNKLDVLSTAFAIARFSRSGAGGSAGIDIVEGSGGYSRLATPGGTSNMSFRPGGTELMLLDSSGNLGIGTSSPSYKLSVAGTANAVALGTTLAYGTSGEVYSAFRFNNSSFSGGNSEIRNIANGAAYVGSALTFLTSDGSSATLTERARIDSSGNLLVGTTGTGYTNADSFTLEKANGYEVINHSTSRTSGAAYILFGYNTGGIGSITQSGTTGVLYNITSDYRLKEVIGAVSGSGERIDALQPIDYTMKTDGSQHRGFLAHQFQAVYANSVSGEKDAVDADGNPIYQQMQAGTAEVIADLVAEIKSLRIRLAALEAK